MKNQILGALALTAAVMAAGPAGAARDLPPPAPDGGYRVIAQGTHSGIESRRQIVIEDAGAFRTLWAEHAAGTMPAPPVPEVDFSRDRVVAVFAGSQPTGGYALQPSPPEAAHGRPKIRFTLKRPGPNCMATQAMTQPFAMVRIPKSKSKVEIQVAETTVDC
jgi:hypothetical protein